MSDVMDNVVDKIKEEAIKLKDGAIKLTHKVIGKTNNVVDRTKVKFAISDINGKINDIYAKIGEELYKSHTDGTTAPDFSEEFASLDGMHGEITDLNDQLSELKEAKLCTGCGTYNDKDNEYCSKCGAPLNGEAGEEEAAEEEAAAEEEPAEAETETETAETEEA